MNRPHGPASFRHPTAVLSSHKMPTYDFACPQGHEFEKFYKMSEAPAEAPCPACGAAAVRKISGGAGLVFKGSGFYLTDYGKNAHRGDAPKKGGSEGAGEKATGEGKAGDAGGAKSETAKSEGAKSEGAKGPDTKPPASKPAESPSAPKKGE